MPREALTRAMEELIFSFGTTSRSRAMPSGTMPMPMPWRPRPMIMGTTVEESAQTTEPTISGTAQASSMRRLPSRSPRRPETGTQTAETSRVTVITQAALEDVVFSSLGSSAMSGVTRVCMTAATVPAKASVATTPPDLAVGWGASMRWDSLRGCGPAYRDSDMHRTCLMCHTPYVCRTHSCENGTAARNPMFHRPGAEAGGRTAGAAR